MQTGEGKPLTSLPVVRSACAATMYEDWGTKVSGISPPSVTTCSQQSTFHDMLRAAVCFLSMRTMLPSRNSMVTGIQIDLNTRGFSASACTLAQV